MTSAELPERAEPAGDEPALDIRRLYDRFDAPVIDFDCGRMCAPHNPRGKPFCCDICEAVPVAFHQEWAYLQQHTDLWHVWRGDECATGGAGGAINPAALREQAPEHLTLLACLGPEHCQRSFRALSCREFPFFPYITSDDRFIGLAYEWGFESTCWVISHLDSVTPAFRRAFIQTYDDLFALWEDEYESYYALSQEMREHFAAQKRRIPILHRNGGDYLLSPHSERLRRADPRRFRKFGLYKQNKHGKKE